LGAAYEVVEAHDGLDALEKLERAEPDFIVLDVMMPLMDGFETCRAIRNNANFRDIPILFLSARRSTQAIKEGYGAGANLYLTKPFEPDRLVRNVEQFLREYGAKPRPKRYSIEALEAPGAKPTPDRVAPVEPPKLAPPKVQAPTPPVAAPAEAPAKPPAPPRRHGCGRREGRARSSVRRSRRGFRSDHV
jgi:CheY-like chemotaxis protein